MCTRFFRKQLTIAKKCVAVNFLITPVKVCASSEFNFFLATVCNTPEKLTHQSPIILDLCLKKTQSGKSHNDYLFQNAPLSKCFSSKNKNVLKSGLSDKLQLS